MKTKTDISYGIIPLRQTAAGWEVFLIYQYSGRVGDTYWTLPKGHAEDGETPVETARRELHEETGLTVEQLLPEPTFENEYVFTVADCEVHKTVRYFLATVTGRLQLQPEEVHGARWVPVESAVELLDFEANKKMFAQVQTFLGQAGELF